MKKILFLGTFLLLCGHSIQVSAEKIKKGKDGMYWQSYDSYKLTKFMYHVDTLSQQCFAWAFTDSGGGLATIPCSNLSKRPEWKEIISWKD